MAFVYDKAEIERQLVEAQKALAQITEQRDALENLLNTVKMGSYKDTIMLCFHHAGYAYDTRLARVKQLEADLKAA